ncbi:MAG: hypothetical protein ACTHOR_11555 [Devosia sp.]|jgi:hypothetical protein|nr:hypothetical protein [Devosiaceae bacterium]
MARILHKREEIRDWVLARGGAPMLEDLPDGTHDQILLQLTFGQHALNADGNEGPDRVVGFELASWDDWFAEFDKQQLALKVNDEVPGRLDHAYEFVARSGHGTTTDAARQPPAGSIAAPGEYDPRND